VPRFGDPELLRPEHVLAGFRSGDASLDTWLRDRARTAAGAGSARTYVVVDAEQERVVLLARLAVDESVQGRGIGAFLLRDAMTRTAAAAGRFGIRALLVHALHDEARAFYLRHGLEPSPTDKLHLMILVKDIRAAIEAAGDGSA
jgi:GNAT superfamily N-acetyltransferase